MEGVVKTDFHESNGQNKKLSPLIPALWCGKSPSFAVWRQAAADRMSWRQMCGQLAPLPRPKSESYAGRFHEIIYGPLPRLGTPAA